MLTRHLLLTGISLMLTILYFSCKTPGPLASAGTHPVSTTGNEYYDDRTAKYLGKDNADTGSYRLIDSETYSNIVKTDTGKEAARRLQGSSRIIRVNDSQIQSDLQWARDSSLIYRVEYQVYIFIDTITKVISCVRGEPGDNKFSYPEIKASPQKGVIYTVVNHNPIDNWLLIAQAHGHPPSNQPDSETAQWMSPADSTIAACAQIPIYGIDAMEGRVGTRGSIHRANPQSTQTRFIGKTWGRKGYKAKHLFNLGIDALKQWGEAQTPDFKCIDSLDKKNKAANPRFDNDHPRRLPIP